MNKGGSGARRPKTGPRGHPPPGDFIALGNRSSRVSESELKPLQPLKPPQPLPPKKPGTTSLSERKRDSTTSLTPLGVAKRPKLSSPTYPAHSLKAGDGEGSKRPGPSSQSPLLGQVTPIEVTPSELEEQVIDAEANGIKSRVDALLLGAIKNLKSNRVKPDPMMYMSLLFLAKSKPELFMSRRVIEALTSILKREGGSLNIKPSKGANVLVPVMACNILLYAFSEEEDWPESFVKVYVEDALGDRVWVDSEHCRSFVENIWTAFGTKTAPRTLSRQHSDPSGKQPHPEQAAAGASQGAAPPKEEEEVIEEVETSSSLEDDYISVIPRFTSASVEHNIQTYILELVHDQLTRRQPLDSITRNLLKLLTVTCGYGQIRLLVSQRLEMWLQNPKVKLFQPSFEGVVSKETGAALLTRPAQELLMSLALNCNSHSNEDVEVISNLIRMRMKTKPLANHYVACIKELVDQHPENLGTLLKYVIYNELSTSRNPNNMSLLCTIFQSKQEKAAKLLAMVFQDLLTNKDDYLRASRALLREIVRALRHELDFVGLCRGFMKERTESQFKDLDAPLKDRLLLSLTDLVCMTTFLSITSSIKEAYTAAVRGEKKDVSVLHEFQKTVSTIQRDAVWWLHVVVPKMFNPNGKDFLACLNRVLFLEPVESYTGKDNWPAENDRSLLLSIVSEVPVQEDTLMRTIIIGLSNELPLTAPETLEIADSLVRRAAAVKMPSAWMQENSALSVSRLELLDAVLNLCAYHHPKDIALPHGYTAPKLAIGNLYWKGWVLLAIVASLNPSSIGQSGWENFPMLKCLMEMLMTNNFTFPPPTAVVTSEDKDQILAQDAQLAQVEKEEILEFEAHLAAATTGVNITEGNSLLLSQLISMDPVGPARRPPLSVIDQLKAANKSLRLGQMLCRSRSPDFLLDIIQRQGASQSMPWLAELVQSSEGSLDVLPVQCLCEFLLLEKTGDSGNEESDDLGKELRDKRIDIQKHVLGRLRFLLFGADADAESTVEVLEYFMRRLSSVQTVERDSAVKGLELVLSQETVRSEDHVTVVCGEDEEGDAMVTTLEELSSPSLPASGGIAKSYQWLLVNLQTLPHFDTVRTTCCFALRQSCQVEIIPERLQAYLMFLADHATDDNEEEFLAAVVDISQLIIERPTIMNAVLGEEPGGEDTYHALLKLYSLALEEAIESQDRVCSWQEMSEQLFVQWSKDTEYAGKAATLHVMIIHAMIVLLTYGEPQGDTSLYAALLDAWCPARGHVKVYLTDTGDEAILLHEWLRLRMIRSHVPRVVDAALNDLLPSQLVLFAQSFGIPVDSMSKLLQQLDVAAQEDAVALEESVLDKGYMAQLVEVQQLRGALGGDAFCCLLCEPPVRRESADLEALDGGITPLLLGDLPQSSPIKESPMSVDESEIEPQMTDAIFESFISPGTFEPAEQRRLESRVQKVLTREVINTNHGEIQKDSCLAEHLIEKLNEVLDSGDGQRLVNGMFDKSSFSCSLLRLLMSRQTALKRSGIKGSGLVTTIRKLSAHKLKGGPLSSAILQYRKQLGISEQRHSADNILEQLVAGEGVNHVPLVRQFLTAAKDCMIKPESVCVDAAVKACARLKKECSPLFEDFVKAIFTILIAQCSKKNQTAASTAWSPQQSLPLRTCAEILVELLKDSDNSRDHLANGLYVDWYEIMDPEIVHIHPLLQRQLLFRDRARVPSWDRSVTSKEDRSPSSYLLGLLTHQASWNTLQDCLDWLLGLEDVANNLNPTAALDFVWTCFHIPRLWQGRDQKSAAVGSQRHAISAVYEKPLLNLAASQISALTGIILSEISSTLEDWCLNKGIDFKQFLEEMKDETFTGGEEKRENIEIFASRLTGRRLQLVSLCCHVDKKKLQPVVSCILKSKRWFQWFSAELLVQLYLAQPSVVRWIKDFRSFFNSGTFSQCSRCQLDVLCHRILTSLADSKPGKEYEDRAYNCSLLLRKLACDHPMLLLRHLPMIAAQLRGRVHLKSKEFTNQQHLLVFSHVLGLMDLLRPHIFKPDKLIQEGLKDTLEAYISLLQAGCLHNKELAAVVAKFMTFLHHFCAESPDQAFATLHCKSTFFHELLQDFPSLPSLQCVVSAISIPSSTPSVDSSTQDSPSGESTPPTPPRVRSLITPPESVSWTSSQLASSVQRLAPGQPVDDVLKVLVDLDETSKRRVDILEHFVPHLSRLLHDSNVSCRTQAHMLLLRHIRQNPSVASKFVNTYLECLNSSEADVVSTSAKYLSEFVVLTSEYSSRLLQKMFSLAVYDSLDVGVPLLQSVQLLNLD